MKNRKWIALLTALLMTLALVGAAAAEPLKPLPPRTDINHLDERFITTDLEYKGDGIVTLTLFENERFDANMIKELKEGDSILTDGEEVTINAIEWDGPDLYFNRGTETEMLFCEDPRGFFEHVIENDAVPQVNVGSIDQELLAYITVLDWVDAETGEQLDQVAVRNGEDLKALLESGNGPSFAVKNVKTLFMGNQPYLIWRFYSPAQ